MTTTRSSAASGSGRLLAFISIAMVVDLDALVLLGSLAEERRAQAGRAATARSASSSQSASEEPPDVF